MSELDITLTHTGERIRMKRVRGSDWPGCPERCIGAPAVPESAGEAA